MHLKVASIDGVSESIYRKPCSRCSQNRHDNIRTASQGGEGRRLGGGLADVEGIAQAVSDEIEGEEGEAHEGGGEDEEPPAAFEAVDGLGAVFEK